MASKTLSALSDSLSGASDILNGSLSTNPTITPIIDLTNVKNGVNTINGMFDGNTTLNAGTSYYKAANVSQGVQSSYTSSNGDASAVNTSDSGTVVTLTQYNYSPESLSQLDIYRQTNNQLLAMKEALNKP
jgi:hypothetical protein